MFSARAVLKSYKEDNWGNQVNCVPKSVKERFSREGTAIQRDLRTEAEESPLLEAVTREEVVKTQYEGNDLACTVVVCKVWK